MQEELLQFKLLNVWTMVDLPHGKRATGTKWVFRNKRDQRGIVVRNKASLVAQGHGQEEGINYDEFFALEVYVSQPPGFVDPEFLDIVYKVEKALYGLHQAPSAWYETLSTYLLENRFRRGTIDKTLFINQIKNDILLVQVLSSEHMEYFSIKINMFVTYSINYVLTMRLSIMRGDSVERAITTDASLEAAQESDNIIKTQTMAMPNVDIPQGMDPGGSPRCQKTMGGTHAQTRVTTLENELLRTKAFYHKAFITLTKRVKKLETQLKQKKSRAIIHSSNEEELSLGIKDSPKQERMIGEIDKDKTINLVSKQGEVQQTVEPLEDDDATLAKTLLNIKRSTAKDKGKGIMQETKLPRKIRKREMIQLSLDEELAQNLHAEELAKETARQEQERYHALQNKVLSKAEVRKNMCTYLKNQGEYKQSYFKGMKYEDIRPIFERVWDKIHTFVPKDSKIKKEVMKISGFNLQQESSKKQKLDEQTEDEVEAQADIDQDTEEMKLFVKIVPDEDIAIDAIPLATKPLVIVEYKIIKEGKISTYHIIRADGSTKRYTSMIKLLENIDREDLETLWKLVKDKHRNTRPGEDYERVLWGDINVMFEPDIKSEVRRQLQGYDVTA
uniref:Ribonuclease H-like domain-containing protein n=1 Tax=Tanacetum cinerariifolium TaxID=118510 RepID=A0A6L2NMJ5_TANCI|nr:ribonuclease H-like domain-containing protein [Tanacetum cinerariifolium]